MTLGEWLGLGATALIYCALGLILIVDWRRKP